MSERLDIANGLVETIGTTDISSHYKDREQVDEALEQAYRTAKDFSGRIIRKLHPVDKEKGIQFSTQVPASLHENTLLPQSLKDQIGNLGDPITGQFRRGRGVGFHQNPREATLTLRNGRTRQELELTGTLSYDDSPHHHEIILRPQGGSLHRNLIRVETVNGIIFAMVLEAFQDPLLEEAQAQASTQVTR